MKSKRRKTSKADILPVAADDPEMLAAMQRARETFSDFRHAVEADWSRKIPVVQSAMIKAFFRESENSASGEHLWLDYEGFENDLVTGSLLSQPEQVENLKPGNTVAVPLSQLSDWLYVCDKMAHGAFTVQLLRSRMSRAERQQHDRDYPFSFDQK